jgi:hypothetical protein
MCATVPAKESRGRRQWLWCVRKVKVGGEVAGSKRMRFLPSRISWREAAGVGKCRDVARSNCPGLTPLQALSSFNLTSHPDTPNPRHSLSSTQTFTMAIKPITGVCTSIGPREARRKLG